MNASPEEFDQPTNEGGASARLQFRVPAELSQRLDDYVANRPCTASDVGRDAITAFLDQRVPARPAIKYLTNEGAHHDTSSAWRFYGRVRDQFADWNHVVLTYRDDVAPQSSNSLERKYVLFVDDAGNRLLLEGTNFGYGGDTPTELCEKLVDEGFHRDQVEYHVLNPTGRNFYPYTIGRD
ncbi:MAG: hypothetical protein K0U78_20045 [Actinomycetia bacterium]|nr:hypothetical protein [Actinomycetes bacterium]